MKGAFEAKQTFYLVLQLLICVCVCVHACVHVGVVVGVYSCVGGGVWVVIVLPCWFSRNNSETLLPWHFATSSNISLETPVPNLVSLTRPSL